MRVGRVTVLGCHDPSHSGRLKTAALCSLQPWAH